jgi:hypothetical protein
VGFLFTFVFILEILMIKETRIDQIMCEYLDNTKYSIELGDEIFLIDGTGTHHFNYRPQYNNLLISNEVAFGLIGMFGLSLDEGLDYIGGWFEDKFDVKVNSVINWDIWN